MPELLTHLAVTYLAQRGAEGLLSAETAPHYPPCPAEVALYIGAVLPDALTRTAYTLVHSSYWLVAPLHTPVGVTIVCLLGSMLFAPRLRRRVALNLLAGAYLHLALDFLQSHAGSGYSPFFPFSWWTYRWGLFDADASLSIVLFLVAAVGAVEFVRFWRYRQNVAKTT